MDRAIEKHRAGSARVIPVMVRPVDFEGVPFASLQALPREAKPITEWRNLDTAWADVARGIRAAAQEARERFSARAVQAEHPVPPKRAAGVEPADRMRPDRAGARALDALYLEYWTAYREAFVRSGIGLRPPTPGNANYVRHSLRSAGVWMQAFATVRDRYIGVELILQDEAGYLRLKLAKEEVERALGRDLDWREYEGSCRVVCTLKGVDVADRADWPRQHERLIEIIKDYQQVLLSRLQAL